MVHCTSCTPSPDDPQQLHDGGDHYGGDGACSRCPSCTAFTPAAEDAGPVQLALPVVADHAAGDAVATLAALVNADLDTFRRSIGERDAKIMQALDGVDSLVSRAAVIEADHRQLVSIVSDLATAVAALSVPIPATDGAPDVSAPEPPAAPPS